MAAGAEILRLCVEAGGSITGEHGVGLEKREHMRLMFSDDDLAAMAKVRAAFGSQKFNPGKVFPTDMASTNLMDESQLLDSIRSLVAAEAIAPAERVADYTVDGLTPQIAVAPATAEEVAAVLAAAARAGCGGHTLGRRRQHGDRQSPKRYDVALDVTRLNQVVQHEPADLTIAVQGGISLQELQDHLARSGQYLPLDPPHRRRRPSAVCSPPTPAGPGVTPTAGRATGRWASRSPSPMAASPRPAAASSRTSPAMI